MPICYVYRSFSAMVASSPRPGLEAGVMLLVKAFAVVIPFVMYRPYFSAMVTPLPRHGREGGVMLLVNVFAGGIPMCYVQVVCFRNGRFFASAWA